MAKKIMTNKEYKFFMEYVGKYLAYSNYGKHDYACEMHDVIYAFMEGRSIPHRVTVEDARQLERAGVIAKTVHFSCGHTDDVWEDVGLTPVESWVEYEGDNPVLHEAVREVCDTCLSIEEAYEMEANMDQRFHQQRWIHSLDAYRGKVADTIREHFEGFKALNWEAEVCCTDAAHMAGSVGLVIKGTVTGVFDYDCWSIVSPEGKRYASRARSLEYGEYAPSKNKAYYESWVKNAQVEEVIVRKDIISSHPKRWAMAKEMAMELGVNIRVFETGALVLSVESDWDESQWAPMWA